MLMNITQIDLIGIPVTDQQVALDFYTKILGFEERLNMAHLEDENTRWIELVPPGAATAVVLSTWDTPGTGGTFQLVTTDIEADYAELRAKGLDLPPLEHLPWGISVVIKDPDGNELLLQQNLDMTDEA
jgi:catechol 2,3-dioxygenase-like lactoylglutathione lyase family enzyme